MYVIVGESFMTIGHVCFLVNCSLRTSTSNMDLRGHLVGGQRNGIWYAVKSLFFVDLLQSGSLYVGMPV